MPYQLIIIFNKMATIENCLQRRSKSNPHGLTKVDLEELCRLNGQAKTGTKPELWARLITSWRQKDPAGWEKNLQVLTHPTHEMSIAACTERKSRRNPHGRSVEELREACSALHLSIKGNKHQLCTRLYPDNTGQLTSGPVLLNIRQLAFRYALLNRKSEYAKFIQADIYQIADMVNVYNTIMAMQECKLKADVANFHFDSSQQQKTENLYVDGYRHQKMAEVGCFLPDSKVQFLVCLRTELMTCML